MNVEVDVGLDAWKENGTTLGWSGFKQPDREAGGRITGFERRGVRGMRGDQLGSWRGLTGVRSIGRRERDELSIRKRVRVGLVSIIVPYG